MGTKPGEASQPQELLLCVKGQRAKQILASFHCHRLSLQGSCHQSRGRWYIVTATCSSQASRTTRLENMNSSVIYGHTD